MRVIAPEEKRLSITSNKFLDWEKRKKDYDFAKGEIGEKSA